MGGQFGEIAGLLEGAAERDKEQWVDMATTAALRGMMRPGVVAVSAPVIVGFGLGAASLGGMLAGALLACVLMALMMANAGGAWDNAKKYVEKGNLGGKGSDTHSAVVVGDTVGVTVGGGGMVVGQVVRGDKCLGFCFFPFFR